MLPEMEAKHRVQKPPANIHHKVVEANGHRVIVNPLKWRNFKGQYSVTEAMAYCKCGWDTPKLFSLSAAEAAAKGHVGLMTQ